MQQSKYVKYICCSCCLPLIHKGKQFPFHFPITLPLFIFTPLLSSYPSTYASIYSLHIYVNEPFFLLRLQQLRTKKHVLCSFCTYIWMIICCTIVYRNTLNKCMKLENERIHEQSTRNIYFYCVLFVLLL